MTEIVADPRASLGGRMDTLGAADLLLLLLVVRLGVTRSKWAEPL